MTPRTMLCCALLAATSIFSVRSATCSEISSAGGRTTATNALRQFYASEGNKHAWAGENLEMAKQALQHLQNAEQYGLAAGDYTVQTDMPPASASNPEQVARFDFELTASVLNFLTDLHFGRAAPDYRWYAGSEPHADFDPAELLRKALKERRLDAAIAAAEPRNPFYHRVKQTLAHYRKLAPSVDRLAPLPALPADAKLRVGMPYAGIGSLVERLTLLGDMTDPVAARDGIYTSDIEAAVRHFQMRHGLAQDGVIGRATISALSVPLLYRIRQLELTLERLRWMPALPPGPLIVVNVPSYRLWALDTRTPASPPQVEMRVIVGNAARTPTPLFIGQLRYLEFNPAWNVPRSIEQAEIVPKLARDPAYLQQQDMELVSRDGRVFTGGDALAALRAGAVRVRQRPGARNVLGAVKFAMPNPMNIYLHATSAQELFSRHRRDLSHGCIRLEQPAALAEFVLRDQGTWDSDAVREAMQPGPTRTVLLDTPVPVVLLYATAVVDRQGRALFLEDIYGLDKRLIRNLELQRTAAPRIGPASFKNHADYRW